MEGKGNGMKKLFMFFRSRYFIYCILTVLLITAGSPRTVRAEGLLDTKGSITLKLEDLEEENSNISNVGFSVFRVGVPSLEDGTIRYTLAVEALEFQGNINSITSGEENVAAAKELLALLKKQGITGIEQKTDANGGASWSDLETGLYLIWETDGSHYGTVNPFLAAIPMMDEEGMGWIYDVVTYPKGEAIHSQPGNPPKEPEKPTKPENPKKPESPKTPVTSTKPKTGDTLNWQGAALCFLLSGTIWVYLGTRKREKKIR